MVELDEEETYVNICVVAEAAAESVPLIDTTIERGSFVRSLTKKSRCERLSCGRG